MRLISMAFVLSLTLNAWSSPHPADPIKAGRMRVLFTEESQESSVWVRCAFSAEQDIVLNFRRRPIENFVINSYETRLVPSSSRFSERTAQQGELVHVNGDDATPWHINGTYIGGNHGCASVLDLTVADGALSVADIGSSWRDGAGVIFYVIDLPGPGVARVMSENRASYPFWKFDTSITGSTLTRSTGQASLAATKSTLTQLWPCARITEQRFLANGKKPLIAGEIAECDFLEIVEEYDIINPASVLADVIAHPGQRPDYVASRLDAVIHNQIVYRIHPNAATTILHRATALQSFDLEFMGFIQQALLHRASESSSLIRYYIPKANPFQQDGITYDFRSIQDFDGLPRSPLRFARTEGVGERAMPERFIQFLAAPGSAKNQNGLGLAFGYSLTSGLTAIGRPFWQRRSAGFIHTTGKTYPFVLDDSIQNPVTPGTAFECLAYRQYFNPALQANATCVYWHRENEKTIVYIDYHKAVSNDTIHLPESITGRSFRILEKSDSLMVDSAKRIPRDGLKVTSPTDHGSLVIEVSD